MAYCELVDVQARAGDARRSWTTTSRPSLEEVDTLIDDAAAQIDALLSAHGHTVPVTATVPLEALREPNAEWALLKALEATPGAASQQQITALQERVAATIEQLRDGTHPAVAALSSSSADEATSLTIEEPNYLPTDNGLDARNPYMDPAVYRGMRL